MDIYKTLEEYAHSLGLSMHVASTDIEFSESRLREWIRNGYHADMEWMTQNTPLRIHPHTIFRNTQSILVFSLSYAQNIPKRRGKIALYSLGRDYHKVLKHKLQKIVSYIHSMGEEAISYVDTAPIMEKCIASTSGAGWIGKSSLTISEQYGAVFFLGEIFTSLNVAPSKPLTSDKCGFCTQCIEACPTQAILPNRTIDARTCISYLTIEHKGSIPMKYRKLIHDLLYGCDKCSVACIYNPIKEIPIDPDFSPRTYPDVRDILYLTQESFTSVFAGSAIHRIGLSQLQRNACIVLGNIGTPDDIPALQHIQTTSESPILHEHAQWGIDMIRGR
ncbi:MAG: tRNA epoxyqueuosine(34) reductase QueG [Bacteroidales bacterium]|jgi:epoxyqueuosine reductase|nr:tRNA epoxyqueuosine(34) reductase QueG [Bacteroidales bacterium]